MKNAKDSAACHDAAEKITKRVSRKRIKLVPEKKFQINSSNQRAHVRVYTVAWWSVVNNARAINYLGLIGKLVVNSLKFFTQLWFLASGLRELWIIGWLGLNFIFDASIFNCWSLILVDTRVRPAGTFLPNVKKCHNNFEKCRGFPTPSVGHLIVMPTFMLFDSFSQKRIYLKVHFWYLII